jgi:hypothetical protein
MAHHVSTMKTSAASFPDAKSDIEGHATHVIPVCVPVLLAVQTGGLSGISAPIGLVSGYFMASGIRLPDPVFGSPTGRSDAGGIASISPPGGAQKTCTPLNSPPLYE